MMLLQAGIIRGSYRGVLWFWSNTHYQILAPSDYKEEFSL